jgi:diaminohydroxyphosphoribosylaminopyrimidine deaminase/5-amino-6-(5-phosphoribosylamino)uracil reductase
VNDEKFMRAALLEAGKGLGRTSPNPAVGAAIVRGGKIIARGFHRAAGCPHAEVEALRKTKRAKGATLYVTLEPCSTHGRTPPCTEAIVAAGISRVVIGAKDPNPRHAGRALKILRRAGIEVTCGILEKECRELNAAFNKWITTGMPLVIAKAAMSLDGRITRPRGEGQWLTGGAARRVAHKLRAQVDAIIVGAETVRADNPRLTVRGVRGAKQPWRVVLTRSGRLPEDAHIFTDAHRDHTLVFRGKSLRAVLRELGRRGVTSVLIEGGADVLAQAFAGRLVDRVQFHYAPLVVGGGKVCVAGSDPGFAGGSVRLTGLRWEREGDDVIVSGDVLHPAKGKIRRVSAR